MNDKKRKIILWLIGIAIIALVAIGVTYAYFEARVNNGAKGDVNVTGDTTDSLVFDVSNSISLSINQFNFGSEAGNLSSEATASATLRANNTNNIATYNYYVYFKIDTNEYIYTTEDKKPEIVLTIIDPKGNPVTEIDGLTYVEATNADGKVVSGFDITTANGLFAIASNYEITSSSSNPVVKHDWVITASFINLKTDQEKNTGKTLNGKILIQRKPEDVTINLAIKNSAYTMPSIFETSCTSGTGVYEKYNKKLIVSNFLDNATCTITASTATKTYFNTYLINLSNAGTDKISIYSFTMGSNTINTGYRYRGENPNNYVWFNDELWRIIGVFGSDSHGMSGENLVKIARSKPLNSFMWSNVEGKDWSKSGSKVLLNNYYYNRTNATGTSYCSYESDYIPHSIAECDFSGIGIKSNYRNMIRQTTWYLGTRPYNDSNHPPAGDFYYYERRRDFIKNSSDALSTTAYIGLPYVSDYAFSLSVSAPANYTIQNNILKYSWLYDGDYVWTLDQEYYNDSYATAIVDGDLFGDFSVESFNIKPTLYLKSNVYLVGGSGTKADPYVIGM